MKTFTVLPTIWFEIPDDRFKRSQVLPILSGNDFIILQNRNVGLLIFQDGQREKVLELNQNKIDTITKTPDGKSILILSNNGDFYRCPNLKSFVITKQTATTMNSFEQFEWNSIIQKYIVLGVSKIIQLFDEDFKLADTIPTTFYYSKFQALVCPKQKTLLLASRINAIVEYNLSNKLIKRKYQLKNPLIHQIGFYSDDNNCNQWIVVYSEGFVRKIIRRRANENLKLIKSCSLDEHLFSSVKVKEFIFLLTTNSSLIIMSANTCQKLAQFLFSNQELMNISYYKEKDQIILVGKNNILIYKYQIFEEKILLKSK